jgi:hypothetical protein
MHTSYLNRLFLLIFLTSFFSACDHGLSPDVGSGPARTGISGTIIYSGQWPADSLIFDLKLVVFQTIPADSTQIFSDVMQGKAKFYPENVEESLPYGASLTPYEMGLDPGYYEYIVVAQQYGSILQWRLIGQYDTTPGDSMPTGVNVVSDIMLTNINVHVDWDNPPVLPF